MIFTDKEEYTKEVLRSAFSLVKNSSTSLTSLCEIKEESGRGRLYFNFNEYEDQFVIDPHLPVQSKL